ncbi:MAG: hypothetical protein F6K49_04630 [Moorea sp. SIO3I6]|nr:hypothetical protein [Moorena sp. SIO3I6]
MGASPKSCLTWWVEWASCCGMGILLWNGHLVVEWASCCGMGILLWNGHLVVEWASCCGMGILLWNGHLVVEWASCPFQFSERTVPKLATEKMRASPSLKHPTQLLHSTFCILNSTFFILHSALLLLPQNFRELSKYHLEIA